MSNDTVELLRHIQVLEDRLDVERERSQERTQILSRMADNAENQLAVLRDIRDIIREQSDILRRQNDFLRQTDAAGNLGRLAGTIDRQSELLDHIDESIRVVALRAMPQGPNGIGP